MGISLIANYGNNNQQSFLKTKSNKGTMVGAGLGVATGLAVSYSTIKNYVTAKQNLAQAGSGLLDAIKTEKPDFSADKFLKNMKKGTIATAVLNTVATTAIGIGVGFLVDKAIDYIDNKRAKKTQQA